MNENVEALAVQHQPRHDVLELRGLEDHVELRDGMRSSRLVAESAGLDGELAYDRVAQSLGNRLRRGIVIDVGVIAFELGHCMLSSMGCAPAQYSPARPSCKSRRYGVLC